MKALVGAFNQEKALVGAFSVIIQLHRLIDLRHYSWKNGRGPLESNILRAASCSSSRLADGALEISISVESETEHIFEYLSVSLRILTYLRLASMQGGEGLAIRGVYRGHQP